MQANTYAIFSVGKGSNQFIAFLNVVIVLSGFQGSLRLRICITMNLPVADYKKLPDELSNV